jgi:4-amino-4-deoxy-L-arabinose transferase-like glycosyltransferase
MSADDRRGTWIAVIVGTLVALLMHVPFIAGYPLSGTEPHRALTGHTMVETGNWLVPFMGGQPYLRKPPGMYWTIGVFDQLLGSSEFVWRLPSAIAAALTVGLVAWFAGRWFGRDAAWWAALAQLLMLALWPQTRMADIDAMNTLFSAAAGLLVLDLLHKRSLWTILPLAIAFAGSLMLKGPGGLPVVLGALLVLLVLGRRDRFVTASYAWIALLLAPLVMIVWVVKVRGWLVMNGYPPDTSGAEEGLENIAGALLSPSRIGLALTLPLQVLLFAMPASLVMVLVASPTVRAVLHPQVKVVTLALLMGLAVCVLSAMVNPRYAYVLLPLLSVIVGGVAQAYPRMSPIDRWWARSGLVCVALAMMGAIAVFAYLSSRVNASALLAVSAFIGAGLLGPGVIAWVHDLQMRRVWIGLCAMGLILSLAFTDDFKQQRRDRSAFSQAQKLRALVGERNEIVAGRFVLSQPELFWYSGVKVVSPGQRTMLPDEVKPGQFVLLFSNPRHPSDDEYTIWKNRVGDRIREVGTIDNNGRQARVVWFE